ncbi:MAG: MATE family efflux transporter [Pseudomonadota bacterium]
MSHNSSYALHLRSILAIGLPLIGSNLAQFAMQFTDTVMLGRYSVDALAALTIASSFFFALFIVGSGFALAVIPMVASAQAACEGRQVRRITRMGLWASFAFAVLTLPALYWSEAIFLSIGQEDTVAHLAQVYLRIAGWGMIPALIVMVLKSYLAALERTAIVLWVTVAAAVLNVPLNYALIFGNFGFPELGVSGAAIASVAMHLMSMVCLALYVQRVTPEHAIFQRLWRPDMDGLKSVFRLGWPIGITSLSEVGLFTASTIMMGWLGTIPLAAHGIALQLASATFVVHVGLSSAATVRAGQAFGRRDELDLRKGGHTAIALSAVFALVTVILFLTLPEPLIRFFLDPLEDRRFEILAVGTVLLAMAAAFQTVDAAQVMALGLLRGVQDTLVPMIVASFSYWVIGAPISYLLGFVLGYGAIGIWAGLVIGLLFAAVGLMGRFWLKSARIAPSTQLGSAAGLI